MGLTVGVGAIGSAVKFRKDKLERSDGTMEYYNFIRTLLKVPNIDRLVLISKSDIDKLTIIEKKELDPLNKLYNPYKFSSSTDAITTDQQFAHCKKLNTYMNEHDIKCDFCIFYNAQGYNRRNLNIYPIAKAGRNNLSIQMILNYSSPMVWYLNESKVPWHLIVSDIRWINSDLYNVYDQLNRPLEILSQFDKDMHWYHMLKYEDAGIKENWVKTPIKIKYSGIEKVNGIGEEIVDPSNERTQKLTLLSMQRSLGVPEGYRYQEIKKLILDKDVNNECAIYGKWDDDIKALHPQIKGFLSTKDLDVTMNNTRYTVIISTPNGWVTPKYIEVLKCGVVPFFSPTYDTQYHVLPKDHPLRITDSEDLYRKMDLFEKYPEQRIKMVRKLQKDLIPENLTNGNFIVDMINKSNENHNLPFRLNYILPTVEVKKKQFIMD